MKRNLNFLLPREISICYTAHGYNSNNRFGISGFNTSRLAEFNKMSGLSSQVSGAWLFTHNILREYLAAKCLVKMPFDKILEYCCFENSIKPSWLNTFGFVMGLSKDDRLKEWTVNNASEAIVKYGPDNFENPDTLKFLFMCLKNMSGVI